MSQLKPGVTWSVQICEGPELDWYALALFVKTVGARTPIGFLGQDWSQQLSLPEWRHTAIYANQSTVTATSRLGLKLGTTVQRAIQHNRGAWLFKIRVEADAVRKLVAADLKNMPTY